MMKRIHTSIAVSFGFDGWNIACQVGDEFHEVAGADAVTAVRFFDEVQSAIRSEYARMRASGDQQRLKL